MLARHAPGHDRPMPQLNELQAGSLLELHVIHFAVFRQEASLLTPIDALRAAILTAISPLRLDFEVMKMRGRALEG